MMHSKSASAMEVGKTYRVITNAVGSRIKDGGEWIVKHIDKVGIAHGVRPDWADDHIGVPLAMSYEWEEVPSITEGWLFADRPSPDWRREGTNFISNTPIGGEYKNAYDPVKTCDLEVGSIYIRYDDDALTKMTVDFKTDDYVRIGSTILSTDDPSKWILVDVLPKTRPASEPAQATHERASILNDAKRAVTKDRAATHGDLGDNYRSIAQIWSTRLGVEITPEQACIMMVDLKTVRAWGNPKHVDNWVDMAGYAACGGELANGT